jgi:hypothetical protein
MPGCSPGGGLSVEAPLATLRRLAQQRRPQEVCDLCATPLGPRHRHLAEVGVRRLLCVCDPCSILFSGQAEQRYRRVPERVRYLAGFWLPDELWDGLGIPVNMAFFFRSGERVAALYPSPAGPTESLLELKAWAELESANPVLRTLEPEVEALLVNRVGHARDHFLAPIDRCYELVGLIRSGWRGLGGGTEVWTSIREFFESLRTESVTVEASGA